MNNYLLGAIVGDICGSTYEGSHLNNFKTEDYQNVQLITSTMHFTDDSVCTLGVADALLHPIDNTYYDFKSHIQKWCRKYPNGRGYGGSFYHWFQDDEAKPYGSWGNGSAMRVSPIGFFAKDIVECRILAMQSAMCSHNHPEGIRGAMAIAEAIWTVKNEDSMLPLYNILETYYPEWANLELVDIRPKYKWDVSCQGSVPVAILCALEGRTYEDTIRLAISMGGDSDTIGAMAGGIAYAYYKEIDSNLLERATACLDDDIRTLIKDFDKVVNERS